jgi:hypothetical protein
MNMEHLVEWELAGETEVLGENLLHHKSHMTWPGIEPGSPQWEAADEPMVRPILLVPHSAECTTLYADNQ